MLGGKRQGFGHPRARTDERLDPGDRGEGHVPPGRRHLSSGRHGAYGKRSARSVVDADCRSWDIPNLWVCDGSVFPTVGGVNPSLTIQAIAIRTADRIGKLAATGETLILTLCVLATRPPNRGCFGSVGRKVSGPHAGTRSDSTGCVPRRPRWRSRRCSTSVRRWRISDLGATSARSIGLTSRRRRCTAIVRTINRRAPGR